MISSLAGRILAVDIAWVRGLVMEIGERSRSDELWLLDELRLLNKLWLLNELWLETSEMIRLPEKGIGQVLAFEDLKVLVGLIESRELWWELVELVIVRQRVDVVWMELVLLTEIVSDRLFIGIDP